MNPFQWFFIAFCVVQFVLAIVNFRNSRQLVSLAFASLWIAAILLLLNPEFSNQCAAAIGITRGVDLVMYALSFVFLWGHYQHYVRYKRVEIHLTTLVRELAIVQASEPISSPGSTSTH